ncbi:MAG: acetylglutamate kinase [Candidatus Infernicultor aquiphilus]|uniref:Acetylglutamate kinase n=1 Tax=Candidatus Infernicultor aquiphilus TaxID=1805029 RepID=A0A2M7PLS6_9BACT|nr:MAG: acetylglutamate kinase [Candidatus Atribacteria bacterium CG08_land_8_20_14_0_20_33_29]PIW12066.1 MAG: acetylglutamate kinase [Candidatus Atribacteria bacterium CG17_big_fil_post_rev_8_21_14_2_50_34_11]PIY31580.1 MAG: acetylglutamate kinase [Candidatus Atribacteria bacterium CG_4_10_14_3_um_filter_34_13]
MKKDIDKRGGILLEALPYIKKFWSKIIVIKYGGSAMKDKNLEKQILKDIILLKYVGMKPVIVHGGGSEISEEMKKRNKTPQFINGLRVTDEETMDIIEMVLIGKINTRLVAEINLPISEGPGNGVKGIGLSGEDAQLLTVKKHQISELGLVGEVENINPEILMILLEKNYIPVIATVGVDKEGVRYNINADTVAAQIAISLQAEKLIFLTDVDGIFKDSSCPSTIINSLDINKTKELIELGCVQKGMLPKVEAAIQALQGGVKKIHLLNGKCPHSILLEVFTDSGIGTEIIY